MYMIAEVSQYVAVASFAEAWIEIVILKQLFPRAPSPPSRRRGLKYCRGNLFYKFIQVASFAEAWIEIKLVNEKNNKGGSRLLRGGVD